ncbi:hypothetical protein EVC45_25070 [Paraburkholderia sp. UYCP14C]|uniref:hypothetical protein n=1 Tax=Paraburkholderia sp. UYCP14C TaxID=2511130 RepID=UPI00101FFFB6|nr:hypothetical protein [Paraburkholderia sp. UYCP14C]RZF26929.1 hypothetical protein EVC45_25070 [Paraburkholderia sp. UYCP14C]
MGGAGDALPAQNSQLIDGLLPGDRQHLSIHAIFREGRYISLLAAYLSRSNNLQSFIREKVINIRNAYKLKGATFLPTLTDCHPLTAEWVKQLVGIDAVLACNSPAQNSLATSSAFG